MSGTVTEQGVQWGFLRDAFENPGTTLQGNIDALSDAISQFMDTLQDTAKSLARNTFESLKDKSPKRGRKALLQGFQPPKRLLRARRYHTTA